MLSSILLIVFTFTLLLGVIPIEGRGGFQTQIFTSWAFIALNAYIVCALFIYSFKRIRKNPLLALTHFSLICLAVCAFLYWSNRLETEPFRLNFKIPSYRLAGAYLVTQNPRQEPPLHDFGFTIGCSAFSCEKYKPDYQWVEIIRNQSSMSGSSQQTKVLGISPITENGIEFKGRAISYSQLIDSDSKYKKFIQVEHNIGVALLERDKDYEAKIITSLQTKPILLKPNMPTIIGNWQFFLLDYDQNNIIINGVYDPIRYYFTASLWLFLILCSITCLRSFYKTMRGF